MNRSSPFIDDRGAELRVFRDRAIFPFRMSPDEVKALRTRLKATTKDLAHALEIEPATLMAWERGEEFPTKRYVTAMSALDEKGAEAFPRLPTKRGAGKKPTDPITLLADPAMWALIRKILAHADLREAVTRLASNYEDPHT